MRYLLITLMIVLLPLRAWAGNAMAVDMAAQQVLMAQTVAGMPDDCSMHEGLAADAQQAEPATGAAHCSVCDTCELCLPLASLTWALHLGASSLAQASPAVFGIAFASADRAAGFKPPIS